MKSIVALTSLALVSFSSVSPCLAASQAIGNTATQPLASQALPSTAKSYQVAGFFDSIGTVLNTVNKVRQIDATQKQAEIEQQKKADREAAAEKAKQERLAQEEQAKIEQQKKAEAYQQRLADDKATAEAQRAKEEAYFNSLTPEQKKAYLARKQAQRTASEQAGKDFLKLIFGAGMSGGGSSASQQGSMSDQDRWNRDHQQQAPIYQPAPAPVTPIGGDSGIYGSCHNASCP